MNRYFLLTFGTLITTHFLSFIAFAQVIPKDTVDLPPVASIFVRSDPRIQDALTGTTATEFTFDANSSRDDKTSSGKLEVRFDFDNDGSPDTYFSKIKLEKHTFDTPGKKTVRMEVLDSAGNTGETSVTVNIVKNTPPQAFFTVSPIKGTPGTIFSFDVKGSADSQYRTSTLLYRFDWNADGEWDTHYESKTVFRHQFDIPGKNSVILEVRDPEGLIAQSKADIFVEGNQPPAAQFTYKQDKLGANFSFDASSSTDPEHPKQLKFRWDFDYTGNDDIHFDTPFSTSLKTSNKFLRSGQYTVRLQVQDPDGAVVETSQVIHVPVAATLVNILQSVGIDIEGFLQQFSSDQPVTRGELARFLLFTKGVSVTSDMQKLSFPDVPAYHPNAPYISKAVELKYMTVFTDGNFRPDLPVTRADGIAIFFKAFDIPVKKKILPPPFTDVKANYWFYDFIATAYDKGLVQGTSPKTFEPLRHMTRGEAVIILKRFFQQ